MMQIKLLMNSLSHFVQNIKINQKHPLHVKKDFRLTKISEKDRKYPIFVSFRMFPFHGIIIFSELSSNENVRKQHLSANAYFCVNMNFSYTIPCRIVTKTSNFLLVFRSTFTSLFFLLFSNEGSFIITKLLKFALKNLGTEYNWLTLNIVFLF